MYLYIHVVCSVIHVHVCSTLDPRRERISYASRDFIGIQNIHVACHVIGVQDSMFSNGNALSAL